MAQTIPPARYAEQYAIYAQKYRGGKFTVTLKNVLVRGVDASGVPTERRSATREHALPSAAERSNRDHIVCARDLGQGLPGGAVL